MNGEQIKKLHDELGVVSDKRHPEDEKFVFVQTFGEFMDYLGNERRHYGYLQRDTINLFLCSLIGLSNAGDGKTFD